MASRLELHEKLCELHGNRNVYYQPPESVMMKYPAIKYKRINIKSSFANDSSYILNNCYEIIVIDPDPDNEVITKLLKLPNCTFNRHYTSSNLNHDVLTLYY